VEALEGALEVTRWVLRLIGTGKWPAPAPDVPSSTLNLGRFRSHKDPVAQQSGDQQLAMLLAAEASRRKPFPSSPCVQ